MQHSLKLWGFCFLQEIRFGKKWHSMEGVELG